MIPYRKGKMKNAIINADDFGMSRGINEGIIKAHREGILTSATLIANMPGFDHAVELSRDNPRLGVGIHLNIVRGRPLTPADRIPTLVTGEGLFPADMPFILKGILRKTVSKDDIERELRAQIEKILAAGVRASHLDSEKHAHTIPAVFRVVLKLAREYGILRIRFINERCLAWPLSQTLKSWLIARWCASLRNEIRKHGIMTTDRFYGICRSGRMTAPRMRRILMSLNEGTSEIMVHPGFVTPELEEMAPIIGSYYINKFRERELRALLDVELKDVVKRREIRLVNFHGLGRNGQHNQTA